MLYPQRLFGYISEVILGFPGGEGVEGLII